MLVDDSAALARVLLTHIVCAGELLMSIVACIYCLLMTVLSKPRDLLTHIVCAGKLHKRMDVCTVC